MTRKLVAFLIVFLLCNSAHSQTYEFDYMLETEHKMAPDSIIKHIYQYTNSKDNSYLLNVEEVGADKLSLFLLDREGWVAEGTISKKDFFDVESQVFNCDAIRLYRNDYKKKQVKNYQFTVLKDTIINTVAYNHYILKSVDAKREARKKLGTQHYITYKNMDNYKPTVASESAAYEEYKVTKNIPNGLYKQHYIIMPDGKKRKSFNVMSYKICKKSILLHVCNNK